MKTFLIVISFVMTSPGHWSEERTVTEYKTRAMCEAALEAKQEAVPAGSGQGIVGRCRRA